MCRQVRPDHVLLRVLGRSLVLWDAVQPTGAWLAAQLPALLQAQFPVSCHCSAQYTLCRELVCSSLSP